MLGRRLSFSRERVGVEISITHASGEPNSSGNVCLYYKRCLYVEAVFGVTVTEVSPCCQDECA